MNRDRLLTIVKILGVAACLYLFLVGIGGMGYSFKLFGKEFSQKILEATSSPLIGLFIGILATTIVQSSSTTTSIVIGMVAAEAIGVRSAIFMVMGANIGTTVTAKLVSLGHITRKAEFRRAFAASSVHDTFNLITVALLYPLEYFFHILEKTATWMGGIFVEVTGITKPENYLKKITKPAVEGLADLFNNIPWLVLLVSVVITFFMLWGIVKLLQSLVLKKLESFFDTYIFRNLAMSFTVGLILTVMVQSSSITTSLIVPLAGAGVLRLQQIFPFTIGSNIGTTITGLLAALAVAGQPGIDPKLVLAGSTVAFAHFLFNASGAVIFLPFKRVREIPVHVAEWLAEFCLKNRFIPIVFIVLVFYLIPLVFTWSSIAKVFGKD
ncbi:MAG: Na/Pi symporter [Nitrospinaceae bacterium]|jgi:sodium-dependent phosphate cotransporter|nr:Na/Pi symporter [Verrucomicrobiota bacterium]MDP7441646.1 Na/Pi symporter [Verrucomicrobiota bacterium]MEE1550200.1 Na/Pi symporter [Nitrospinaceae bacterium]|tara:strand:+ start:508 stop:1653 length:1146 start_codon:yes stop_codon:yes gene_type:complete